MASLRSKLPPVNSLVVFEAAARLMNFTRAAQELSVTQAAVSRQIQLLEEHLGTQLFQRQPRALKLTLPGVRLHKAVTMSLEHIANTVVDLRRIGPRADITVATSVTFASYWLMAHIAKFRAAHSDVEFIDRDIILGQIAGIDAVAGPGRGRDRRGGRSPGPSYRREAAASS